VKNYLKYLLSIALMAYVFVYYGNDIKLALREVNLSYLPLIILLSLLQYFLSAWRWYFIASRTKSRIDYKDAIKFYYISGFLNNILPTGILGDIYRSINIKINGETKGNILQSLQSVVFERLSGQITLAITFIISLSLFFFINEKFTAFYYVGGFIIIVFLLIKLFYRYKQNNKYITNFKYIFSGKLFYKHFFLSLIIVLTYITTYIICAYSLDLNIDIFSFFVFAPIILFSMTLPVSIGGWGVRETTALAISFLLGLTVSASVTVAIVYGLTNFLCSLPGMYFFMNRKAN
jgi:uncharacterized membrane protein YbhN (UPF0104 family)